MRTGLVTLRLHPADDRPLPVAKQLPPSQRFHRVTPARRIGIKARPSLQFVETQQLLARAQSSRRERIVAETPGAHAEPAEIFERVADMAKLPVEHCRKA